MECIINNMDIANYIQIPTPVLAPFMKKKFALSLDAQVVERTKELAGLVPFSRYVEDLLRKEIAKAESSNKKPGVGE